MTIQEFVDKHHLTLDASRTAFRPDSDPKDKWNREASHWACQIRSTTRSNNPELQVFYSMGSAHKTGPQIADVMDSLRSDAQGADSSFDDWASDAGYDTDSRKALATYEACARIRRQLLNFLGREAFAELLDCEPM